MSQYPITEAFCLYLWRSPDAPGTLYLADSRQSAQAVYAGLLDAGYIVRAMQIGTNRLFELDGGELRPVRRERAGATA